MSEDYADIARGDALFYAAYEHQLRGELDRAEELCRRSISAHPTAEAHTFLGWVMSLRGRYYEAIDECKAAIALDPNLGNPYNDIGAYFIALGRPADAPEWLQRAMVAPRYSTRHFPHINLARVYETRGEWREALGEYEKALELAPGCPAAVQALTRLRARLN
jgi:tetratricopeptide (TPR) repeat protein